MKRRSRDGAAHAVMCATRWAIFSASFNVGTMIETDCARAGVSIMRCLSEMANIRRSMFNDRIQINRSSADDGIRTRDLRFTKPLLYQLSYVGIFTSENDIYLGKITLLDRFSYHTHSNI